MTDTPTPNPYGGDPAPPSVSAGETESDVPSEATESPEPPRDINPDVAAADPRPASETVTSEDSEKPAGPPSVLDRVRALEHRVFGSIHADDPGPDADTDDHDTGDTPTS